MKVKVKKLNKYAFLPVYVTDGSAAFDLNFCQSEENAERTILEDCPEVLGTGLAFEIPAGYAMFIFSRSGHGFLDNIRLSNCVGIIDSDYRGEVKVKLNQDVFGEDVVSFRHGDRIAQAVVLPIEKVEFELGEELSETKRGDGGFGSTGQQSILIS